MILPTTHIYVTYEVKDLCKPQEVTVFTDNAEAQEFYSANYLTMQYPSWETKEKGVSCLVPEMGECIHCAEATHTLEKWTDEIGYGMFRAFAVLPNSFSCTRASNILHQIARKHYQSIGTSRGQVNAITGGAHVNVKPRYTEWNSTYAL